MELLFKYDDLPNDSLIIKFFFNDVEEIYKTLELSYFDYLCISYAEYLNYMDSINYSKQNKYNLYLALLIVKNGLEEGRYYIKCKDVTILDKDNKNDLRFNF